MELCTRARQLAASLALPGPSIPKPLLLLLTLVAAWPLGHLLWHIACGRKLEGKKLPPGSWGWPLVGETLPFLLGLTTSYASYLSFTTDRFRKYGDVFKTHLYGTPYAVVRGAEAVKLLGMAENQLVEAHQLLAFRKVLGEEAIVNVVGARHALLRRVLNDKFTGEEMRRFLGRVDSIALEQIGGYRPGDILSVKEVATKFTFNFITGMIFSWGDGPERDTSSDLAGEMCDAIVSAPINLPGFAFHRGMQARKRLDDMFVKEIERRRSGKVVADDLLTVMLNATHPDSKQPLLDGDALLDNLQILIFAGHETSTSALTWAVHFLNQNPKQLQHLVAEHEEIRRGKAAGEPLNWQDLNKMTFTTQVIQEALRMASLIFYHHRTVKQDFQLGGYDIPKGWNIILDTHAVHYNPDYFAEAETFNPSRFQVPPKPHTFMPFGIGPKYCLGKDMAMMEFCVFLHHFVLKCKCAPHPGTGLHKILHTRQGCGLWTALSNETTTELIMNPMPCPKGGVPIRIDAINTS